MLVASVSLYIGPEQIAWTVSFQGTSFDSSSSVIIVPGSCSSKKFKYKEDFIKDMAEQYKDKIPDKVYQAMLKWTIEITD